jgi:arginine N-succinyltransferase
VGGLFLHPEMRASGLGGLLARSRYLFMKLHRPRFGDRTLAELRGVIDEAGHAPFWDALAGKFFGMSFPEADEFNGIHGTKFIADLMPRSPIYVALLTDEARAVIGQPHPSGRAALRMLEHEGFSYDRYVDIFDGGPTVTARTDNIRTVRESHEDRIAEIGEGGTLKVLAGAGRLKRFRACCASIKKLPRKGIMIDPKAADLLEVGVGDTVLTVAK